jgi:hypothetical protein
MAGLNSFVKYGGWVEIPEIAGKRGPYWAALPRPELKGVRNG